MVALFDRAEPRDFVDVFNLAARYGRDQLLAWAADVDPGFHLGIFVEMLASLTRLRDEDLPIAQADVPTVRSFFADWIAELSDRI